MGAALLLAGDAMVKGQRAWGVVALCLLSGNGWVLTQAWPSKLGWPFAACIHFGLIGFIGLGFVALRGRLWELAVRRWFDLGGTAVCLFAAPAAVLELAAGKISEATSAAFFCAVPLMTVLAAEVLGGGESRSRGLIIPALAGLAGAVLLFPLGNPGSPRRWLFVGLIAGVCIVVAVASVRMHRLMQGIEVSPAVAVVAVASAVMLGLYGMSVGWPAVGIKFFGEEALRGAVLDVPEVWLLVWLIREVEPARLSARFLLVPLVTVVEGYTLERGGLGWRVLLSVGLLCAGGLMLLLKEEPEEIPGLQLR